MSSLRDTALKIEPANVLDHWLVTVSWSLEVPYWHQEGWFSEVVTVHASDRRGGIDEILIRFSSDPWRIDPKPDSATKPSQTWPDHLVVERATPPQTVLADLIDTRLRFKRTYPSGQDVEQARYDYVIANVKVDGPTRSPLEQRSPLMRGLFESGLPRDRRHPAKPVDPS